jgi:hypothetical protein
LAIQDCYDFGLYQKFIEKTLIVMKLHTDSLYS